MYFFAVSNFHKFLLSKTLAPWIFTIFALIFALFVSFQNIDAEKQSGEFYWQSHQEGVSLTPTKYESQSGFAPVDGFSKEFPIVYNFLGDYALGFISDVLGEPPYVTQSFFDPKLLVTLFLLLSRPCKTPATRINTSFFV